MSKFSFKSLQSIAVCGMLIALDVTLRRLMELGDLDSSYSLAFLVVAAAGYWYGPVAAGLVHGVADLLGAVLFPKGSPHLGLMLSAVLIGVVYGVFLYNNTRPWRAVTAVVICQAGISLLLNSFWLSTLMTKGFAAILISRIPQVCVMTVVQAVLIPLFLSQLKKIPLRR